MLFYLFCQCVCVCFLLLYIPMYILSSSDLPFFVYLPVVYLHVYYCNKFEVWCSYYVVLCIHSRGVPRIWEGGGQEIFFSDLGICMSRSDMLRMAKPCALLGGFGGMLPREIFLKRCNLVRFRVYFDQILSLFFSKNAIFYIKNKYFRYTFVMGYFS